MPSTQPFLPTLYKARRVPTKQAVCAICVERTRGRTQELRLGYGVSVWLCEGHASQAFQTQRGGRDLVLTLERLWRSHGCLTAARHKALRAHLAACAGAAARPRPGATAGRSLRAEAEAALLGRRRRPDGVIRRLRSSTRCRPGPAAEQSARCGRWCAERRWLARRPP